jgi:hypothetical protein
MGFKIVLGNTFTNASKVRIGFSYRFQNLPSGRNGYVVSIGFESI